MLHQTDLSTADVDTLQHRHQIAPDFLTTHHSYKYIVVYRMSFWVCHLGNEIYSPSKHFHQNFKAILKLSGAGNLYALCLLFSLLLTT